MVCEEAQQARKVLFRAHDNVAETDVLAVELTNEPGAFASAAERLADAHVNISYAYCTGGAPGGKTTAIFKVADMKKALRVLAPPRAAHKERRETVKRSPRRH